jgi:hypothetical protein
MANSSGGAIAASVLITLVLVGAGLYFGLPYLYPNVKNEAGDVVQVKTEVFKTVCKCYDNEMTQKPMNGTTISITTKGGSYLIAEFSTTLLIQIDGTFGASDWVSFNITMAITGTKNYSTNMEFGNVNAGEWRTFPFLLRAVTPELEQGSYNITMYWFSRFNATGTNLLSANHLGMGEFKHNTRTLMVQEIVA